MISLTILGPYQTTLRNIGYNVVSMYGILDIRYWYQVRISYNEDVFVT